MLLLLELSICTIGGCKSAPSRKRLNGNRIKLSSNNKKWMKYIPGKWIPIAQDSLDFKTLIDYNGFQDFMEKAIRAKEEMLLEIKTMKSNAWLVLAALKLEINKEIENLDLKYVKEIEPWKNKLNKQRRKIERELSFLAGSVIHNSEHRIELLPRLITKLESILSEINTLTINHASDLNKASRKQKESEFTYMAVILKAEGIEINAIQSLNLKISYMLNQEHERWFFNIKTHINADLINDIYIKKYIKTLKNRYFSV